MHVVLTKQVACSDCVHFSMAFCTSAFRSLKEDINMSWLSPGLLMRTFKDHFASLYNSSNLPGTTWHLEKQKTDIIVALTVAYPYCHSCPPHVTIMRTACKIIAVFNPYGSIIYGCMHLLPSYTPQSYQSPYYCEAIQIKSFTCAINSMLNIHVQIKNRIVFMENQVMQWDWEMDCKHKVAETSVSSCHDDTKGSTIALTLSSAPRIHASV